MTRKCHNPNQNLFSKLKWEITEITKLKISLESPQNIFIIFGEDIKSLETKIISEYIQEIPQSQTADKPVASWGKATQQSQDTRKTNKAK